MSQLSWSAAIIPEVTTAIQKTPQQKKENVATFQLTQKEIAASPAVNLASLLQQEQSVVRLTNNSGDSSQTALSIRGFGDNAAANSLILIDGFPLTNPTLLTPNFNAIALTDIDHIEIIQGSQGTLWGDQAVGGVVNIVTRHPKKFNAAMQLGAGNFNHQMENAFLGTQFANGFFLKGFNLINRTDNDRHHNDQSTAALATQVGFDYARGMMSMNLQADNNTIDFPGGLTEAQYDTNPRQATNFTNFMRTKMRNLQFLSKHALSENWLLETRFSHQQMQADGFVFMPFQRHEWENSLNPRLLGSIANKKIILGIEENHSDYDLMNKLAQNRASAQQHHLYAQMTVPVLNQMELTFGGRYAWQDNNAEKILGQPVTSTNRVFVTEQGMVYHLNNTLQFFLRRDGNFRFPKANEETWLSPDMRALQVQTGVSYESGVQWQTAKQQTQLSIYELQLHDEIAFDPTQTAAAPFGLYRNFAETERRGVTLADTYQLTERINLDGQINYVAARFATGENAGKHIPAVPDLNANASIRYHFAPHWQTRYSAFYTGNRYASEDVANTGKKLPGYWLNSVAIQYMLPAREVSVEINNLFNTLYPTYTLFDPTSGTNTYYPGAGRNILLTFKLMID